jgi:hypothetical protein
VAEGVDLPSYGWVGDVEGVLDEAMASFDLVDNGLEVA